MNDDLKIIKKKYGEAMMHLCRCLFATILDNSPGELSRILLDTFAPNHFLYEDLVEKEMILTFKNYIYSIYEKPLSPKEENGISVDDPVTLMKRAGYILYECTSEEDIQKFKKYYAPDEELCTFNGERLERCYVYFAVKDNANDLNRHDFTNPKRQDAYGTSLISIQFTRDDSHMLSIKNRYNHTVNHPDATFANNLDNIIPGLTKSFADYYGMKQSCSTVNLFDLDNYVRANDGKFYRYNYEVNNVYYCLDNIVIDNFSVIQYSKEKYLVMDYFIIDLVNKKIVPQMDTYFYDSFSDTIGSIKRISIKNDSDQKIVTIISEEDEEIEIILNKFNCIVSLKNNHVRAIPDNFLRYNTTIEMFELNNVRTVGDNFLASNDVIQEISLPNVIKIGDRFMLWGRVTKIFLPKVIFIGDSFMVYDYNIKTLDLPNLKYLGNRFMFHNRDLETVSLPRVISVGDHFLELNIGIKTLSLPSVLEVGSFFCYHCRDIQEVNLPMVKKIGDWFMTCNSKLTEINLPEVLTIGSSFLEMNLELEKVILPKVKVVGPLFLDKNRNIREFYAPNLEVNIYNKLINQFQKKEQEKSLLLK